MSGVTGRANPFVGPRSFRTGEQLFGRDHETAELLDLLIAERIVLVNSPSGAGKSSLLNAALLPRLRAEGFVVPPPMRVSQQLPPGMPLPPGVNRYVLSLLLCMEEDRPPGERLPLDTLLGTSLDTYLDRFRSEGGPASLALIVDQFEEVLTIDPTDRESKAAFFDQLARALRSRDRWALFAMREEYVAALEPYAKALPTRLATRYRLELLRPDQAMEAICNPVRDAGLDMSRETAELLIRNLSLVRVEQPDGTMAEVPGPSVEPVQLQVVCRRLWADQGEGGIDLRADQINLVHSALVDYYADTTAGAAKASGVSERAIREWIGSQLITEQGLRGQVPQQPGSTRGLDNRAIAPLVEGYLVRADKRRGLTWYELAHDRLVEPIRRDNVRWLDAHLHPLQRQAALWARQARSAGLLLRADALGDAERWAAENREGLLDVEREFLAECIEARGMEEQERRTARKLKRRAVAAMAALVVALGLAVFAVRLWVRLFLMYLAIYGVVSPSFGWLDPSFDATVWQVALEANTALARAAAGTTSAQRDATTIVLEPIGDASARTAIADILRADGFQNVGTSGTDREATPPESGSAVQSMIATGEDLVDIAVLDLESAPPPRVAVRYGADVDPDIVKVILYTLIRARAHVIGIEESLEPGHARVVRIHAAPGDALPLTLAAVEELLPSAPPDPIFARVLDVEPLARSAGIVTAEANPTRIAFQQFDRGTRMLWIQSEFDRHYVLESPRQGERKGRWTAYSLGDLPPDAAEDVAAFLRDSPDARRTRFQPNGGFLLLWLHNNLETAVGWPVTGTCILGTTNRYVVQDFSRGKMLGPFPRYDVADREYISGREFRQVKVLILFDDNTYVERDVPDPDPDADKYTEVSRLGDSCNS